MEIRHPEGEKELHVCQRIHGLLPDELVFEQIDLLVLHEIRRSGQGGHHAQQAIVTGEAVDGVLDLLFR